MINRPRTKIANLEKASGLSLADWIAIEHQSGTQKHSEVIAMLRERGLTYGNANLIAIRAREAERP